MARSINRIAKVMAAKVVGRVPETGGGAFGAARLAVQRKVVRFEASGPCSRERKRGSQVQNDKPRAVLLARVVGALRERLQLSRGTRPGRPTSKDWVSRSKVPMSSKTRGKLRRLAQQMSTTERKVSPMQVAAQLLEEALAGCPDD